MARRTFVAATLLAALVGCRGEDNGRVDVWGNVVWKGQSVPRGYVTFNPDARKGNRGPQGIAWINEGKFDTREKNGRGCVAGPLKVTVHGYDGQNPSPAAPYGARMFVPYEQELEVTAEGGPIELVLPDQLKAVPASTEEALE